MKRIAKFHKVSREQFILDWADSLGEVTGNKIVLENKEVAEDIERLEDEETKVVSEDRRVKEISEAEKIYEKIRLPHRATAGSAGYDFFLPFSILLLPGETIKIPTGIRAEMEPGWVLQLYPRSGLGFKYRLQMNNTVGIIDSDYFYSDNEGHIMMKLFNDGREGKTVELKAGMAFAQGIFMEYGITVDDEAEGVRNGGFGSTDAGV